MNSKMKMIAGQRLLQKLPQLAGTVFTTAGMHGRDRQLQQQAAY